MAERQQAAPNGSSSYTEADAAELDRWYAEFDADRERKRRIAATGGGYAALECTCKGSPFGMDIDMCPRHGK